MSEVDDGATFDPSRPLRWRAAGVLGRNFELVQDGQVFGKIGRSGSSQFSAWGECLGEEWQIGAVRGFYSKLRVALRSGSSPGLRYDGYFVRKGVWTTTRGERLRWGGLAMGFGIGLKGPGGARWLTIGVDLRRFWTRTGKVSLKGPIRAREDLAQLLLATAFLWITANSSGLAFKIRHGYQAFPDDDEWDRYVAEGGGHRALEEGG